MLLCWEPRSPLLSSPLLAVGTRDKGTGGSREEEKQSERERRIAKTTENLILAQTALCSAAVFCLRSLYFLPLAVLEHHLPKWQLGTKSEWQQAKRALWPALPDVHGLSRLNRSISGSVWSSGLYLFSSRVLMASPTLSHEDRGRLLMASYSSLSNWRYHSGVSSEAQI